MSDYPDHPDVQAAADKVRDLKAAKASKDEVVAAVKEMNDLKEKYGLNAKKEEKKKETPNPLTEGGEPKEVKLTAKQLRILEKEKAKKEGGAATAGDAEELSVEGLYGDNLLIQSTEISGRVWVPISKLESHVGEKVWVRGSINNTNPKGKSVFYLLRQGVSTIQALMFQSAEIPKGMIKYASGLNRESVIDVEATVVKTSEPINSASLKNIELHVSKIFCVSKATDLPFQIVDAMRSETDLKELNEDGTPKYVGVLQDTRLDYRWIDLRTPANQAIMRIRSAVSTLFREFLLKNDFVEMNTPKLIGGASEGGADVFRLSYFNRPACLAQSPQLYKQMVASASGFERCFEIGPVFRAENSNTVRHLCEFTGMDFEMTIKEHYFEALDIFGGLFNYIFDGINQRCKLELAAIQAQYPFEPMTYLQNPLRLTFQEGLTLLRNAGYTVGDYDDLSTETEKALGAIVKKKYGTDFFMLDKYPLAVRPFYTMPDPENSQYSNSYDMFIRGQEIISGAQRIHDVDLLIDRANHWKIPLDTIKGYLDSFRHGAQPHAGGGIGLERVVFLFLGLDNIRKASFFPRDPKRLTP